MPRPPRIRIVPSLAPRIASSDPDTFVPEFDIQGELRRNLGEYIINANEGTRIQARLPVECKLGILTLRYQTPASHRAALTCAFMGGFKDLYNNPSVEKLRLIKDQVCNVVAEERAVVAESFMGAHAKFVVDVANAGDKSEFHVDASTGDKFKTWAIDTGLNMNTLAVLCMMRSIMDQPRVNTEHRNRMKNHIERFLEQCDKRHEELLELGDRLGIKFNDAL